ncbi:hypothetical protein DTO282E5_40 [Paecilomyces variotii]|nr:hypothetical protein DTO282E5_40 [Paecilomyces variotii]
MPRTTIFQDLSPNLLNESSKWLATTLVLPAVLASRARPRLATPAARPALSKRTLRRMNTMGRGVGWLVLQ